MNQRLYITDHTGAFNPVTQMGLVGTLTIRENQDFWKKVALVGNPEDATHVIAHLPTEERRQAVAGRWPKTVLRSQIVLCVSLVPIFSRERLDRRARQQTVDGFKQAVFFVKRPEVLKEEWAPTFLQQFVDLTIDDALEACEVDGWNLPKLLRAVLCDPPTVARFHVKPLCTFGLAKGPLLVSDCRALLNASNVGGCENLREKLMMELKPEQDLPPGLTQLIRDLAGDLNGSIRVETFRQALAELNGDRLL
jgi:hypothetical protein